MISIHPVGTMNVWSLQHLMAMHPIVVEKTWLKRQMHLLMLGMSSLSSCITWQQYSNRLYLCNSTFESIIFIISYCPIAWKKKHAILIIKILFLALGSTLPPSRALSEANCTILLGKIYMSSDFKSLHFGGLTLLSSHKCSEVLPVNLIGTAIKLKRTYWQGHLWQTVNPLSSPLQI